MQSQRKWNEEATVTLQTFGNWCFTFQKYFVAKFSSLMFRLSLQLACFNQRLLPLENSQVHFNLQNMGMLSILAGENTRKLVEH